MPIVELMAAGTPSPACSDALIGVELPPFYKKQARSSTRPEGTFHPHIDFLVAYLRPRCLAILTSFSELFWQVPHQKSLLPVLLFLSQRLSFPIPHESLFPYKLTVSQIEKEQCNAMCI